MGQGIDRIGIGVYSGSLAFRERDDASGWPLMKLEPVRNEVLSEGLAEELVRRYNVHDELVAALDGLLDDIDANSPVVRAAIRLETKLAADEALHRARAHGTRSEQQ